MLVRGAANAGTPAVKDGRLNEKCKFRHSFSGVGIEAEGDVGVRWFGGDKKMGESGGIEMG